MSNDYQTSPSSPDDVPDAPQGVYGHLIAQLDAENDTLAASSLRLLRSTAKDDGLRLADLFAPNASDIGRVAELEQQLAAARERCRKLDQAGSLLDTRLTETTKALADAQAKLSEPKAPEPKAPEPEKQSVELQAAVEDAPPSFPTGPSGKLRLVSPTGPPCWPCEQKRRWLALMGGFLVITLYTNELVPWPRGSARNDLGTITALSFSLYLFFVARWHWRKFKQANHWASARNNDLTRRAALHWNKFLDRFRLSEA